MMKILHGLAAAAVTLCAALTPVTATLAQNSPADGANAELLAMCNEFVESGEFGPLNLGECMSFWKSIEGPGFAAHICDALRENDQLDDAGFTSYSDCVRNF
jgi:hypothetical protein